MDNVIFTNGFEDYIKGLFVCPEKTVSSSGAVNLEFIDWRRHDRMILSQIYSSLTPESMAQIIGHTTQIALDKILSYSSRA